jgi:hypothetical protein
MEVTICAGHVEYFPLQNNYNRKVAPFLFNKVNKTNIPVDINVAMAVTDILKIKEVDHVYTLKFRLVLEWLVHDTFSYPFFIDTSCMFSLG